ncbi:acyl-CoA thioester hydrolase [Sulfuritortus calidifontis]|uniref:Acyl-CoA thioester hydrolase n=1 Tax=Sulfuritortus calidifontis TaxID=1914471 RepID=A0A4V2UR21_9PROT|nr:tol-pal system-associated acyl-CoA thioesterase [Sulfuritortus calidifontis]TCS74067.1 acyl-CoA thioester hydrolase [Sulfuritortus calidifontis]
MSEAQFVWPVRVYWEDTDAGGVVYYANYLKFMERARSEWLRGLGIEQTDLAEQDGLVFVVRHVEVDYLKPARFDDALDVVCSLAELNKASLAMAQRIERAGEPLVTARVKIACVTREQFRPAKIPVHIQQRLGC